MIGCNVTTCPNGKCRATGECVDLPRIKSAPLAPTYCTTSGVTFCKGNSKRCFDCPDIPLPNARRTVVAFTGLAGAGKSTAAAHLVNNRGFQRVRFAGPLKAMMAALGLTSDEIEGNRKELPCTLLGGKTPRWAMQTIGTEWGRKLIDENLWINAWKVAVNRLPEHAAIVVDDCRFPNEAEAIKAAGGHIVRIERPGAGTASAHESELHRLPAILTIRNDKSEADLFRQVDSFLRDLSWIDA